MKVLMLTWEFPPLIAGGLGMACYGMVKSLLSLGVEIDIILPTKETAFFPMRRPEDVETLPVIILDTQNRKEVEKSSRIKSAIKVPAVLNSSSNITTSLINKMTLSEKLHTLGLTERPETYINFNDVSLFHALTQKWESVLISEQNEGNIENWINNFSTFGDSSDSKSAEVVNLINTLGKSLSGEEDIFKKVQEYTVKATKIASAIRDYDIIHAHDWLAYPAGMFLKVMTGKPLVAHIHATEFDRAGGTGNERVHKIEHSGMSLADRVLAVSKYTAQMVINRYRINTAKIRIIHNAHTGQEIEKEKNNHRLFKGPTILFLGRITIQKGPDYFLDVAKMVLQKHPDARFIMAGTGDMARKLLHKSATYRLKNRFLFAGFLNRREVELILSNTDIYLLPSVSEPFGIAPLEAMAYGITAIISKQSGVSEVVENAYKIDFWDIKKMADTISYLIENPDICKEIGIKGMNEVEKIHWDDAAKLINEVYREFASI